MFIKWANEYKYLVIPVSITKLWSSFKGDNDDTGIYICTISVCSLSTGKEPLQTTPDCECQIIRVNAENNEMELNSHPVPRKAGLSRHNLGYELVSQDTLCNFGDELLCTSTPRQQVRGLKHSGSYPGLVIQALFTSRETNNNHCGVRTMEGDDPRAIGDGAGRLNLELFESITWNTRRHFPYIYTFQLKLYICKHCKLHQILFSLL